MNSFREKLYDIVKKIPKGRVMTYASVAARMGHPGAFRAAGSALGKNRSRGVPCHRVVRSDLSVGGYAWGAEKKIQMLKREGVIIELNKVNIKCLWE